MTTIQKQGPLSWNTPIVYPDGRPTQEFMRKWAAQVAANSGIPVDAKTLSAILDFLGTTRGAIIERGATQWGLIAPGTDGKVFRSKGAGADPIWDTISNVLDTISSTRGAVLYRGASGWVALGPGTAGYVLSTNGAGADPAWVAQSGGSSGGEYPYSPPSAASFTGNVNGGAGSISIADVANVGTVFTYGAMANSGQVRGYDMAWTPGKTVTARLKTIYLYQFTGTFIYFTDGTKIITFGVDINGGTPRGSAFNWNSATSFSAGTFTPSAGPQLDVMFRVVDDGTNYNYYVSSNGNDWTKLFAVGRTAFLTATRVGFGANMQNNVSTDTGFVTCTNWSLV